MKRRLAREITIQCLYQMEMNHVSSDEAMQVALQQSEEEGDREVPADDIPALRAYVTRLVAGVRMRAEAIDDVLAGYLQGWKVDRLSRVDRQILRLAVWEMTEEDDVPPKVAINEAIELAKHYGTEESGKFVNGVLGKLIKDLDAVRDKWQAIADVERS